MSRLSSPRDWFLPFRAVVRRELLVTLRGKGIAAGLFLLTALSCLVMYGTYPESDVPMHFIAHHAQTVFQFLLNTLLGVCLLVLPGMSAASMAAEREEETYDQLRLTLVTMPALILGKLCNALGGYALFLVALAPFLSAVLFLVGIDTGQLALSLCVVLSASLFCGAVGVFTGSLARSSTAAIVFAIVIVVVSLLTPLFVAMIISYYRVLGGGTGGPMIVLYIMQPFVPLNMLLESPGGALPTVAGYCGLSSILTIALLCIAMWNLRQSRSRAAVSVESEQPRRGLAALGGGRYVRFPDGINPIFIRELFSQGRYARSLSLRSMTMQWLAMFCYSVFLWLTKVFPSGDAVVYSERHSIWALAFLPALGLLLLIAGAHTWSFLAGERVKGNLDALHLTPLGAKSILVGKVLALLSLLVLLSSVCVLGFLPVVLATFGKSPLEGLGFALLTLASTCICLTYAVALGTLVSVLCRRASTAIAVTYVTYAITFLFGPLLLSVFSPSSDRGYYLLSPVFLYVMGPWLLGQSYGGSGWMYVMLLLVAFVFVSWLIVRVAVVVYEDFVRHEQD